MFRGGGIWKGERREWSLSQTLQLFLSIAKGVKVLHENKENLANGTVCDVSMAHRDLKPANILLQWKAGKLKPVIIDFGSMRRARVHVNNAAQGLLIQASYLIKVID